MLYCILSGQEDLRRGSRGSMERITSWLFSSGGAWTSLEAYPDGSEAGTGWSSSTMVAVGPDLREFCVSAVEQMAIDNKLLANSDELTINEAANIYEQFIAGLWNSPLAQERSGHVGSCAEIRRKGGCSSSFTLTRTTTIDST